jgi:rod shape-determining protein MreD
MPGIVTKLHVLQKALNSLIPSIKAFLIRILAALLLLLPNINLKLGSFAYLAPSLDSVIIFFWTLAQPKLFNPYVLIILGCYFDIITGLPTGFNALLYLIFYYSLDNLRKYFINTSFYAYWAGFAFFSLFFLLVKYLLIALYNTNFFMPIHLPVQWLILQIIYPYFHLLFNSLRDTKYELRRDYSEQL